MKTGVMFILTLVVAQVSLAKPKIDIKKDFDSLGTNSAIAEKAQELDPENRVRIVQNRKVDRTNRLELGFNYGLVTGGDAYYKTQNIGGLLEWHFNPKFSAGLRYSKALNSLTSEGDSLYKDAQRRYQADPTSGYAVPDLDYPIETGLVTVSFYPVYGKFNFFELGVAHFDFYAIAGYGKMNLKSGQTDTYTAGIGVGLWAAQNLAMRLEGRWQPYMDKVFTGERRLDTVVVNATLSVLL
ncbi:MAG: outer membrane beta-barrel domain-containing protein [Oligoflexia bacterium]|nr:outer membrane beta-barrel domain-containing protein [Oligoflexia bacterium]